MNRWSGIKQLCPPGTAVSESVGGCVNKTSKCVKISIRFSTPLYSLVRSANTTVFPPKSRCASGPCQNGGRCYDYPVADAFHCSCTGHYEGVHCQAFKRSCPSDGCDGWFTRARAFLDPCLPFVTDRALTHICECITENDGQFRKWYAQNSCQGEQFVIPNCTNADQHAGPLPFTNKGFYICRSQLHRASVQSCRLGRVWNDVKKECVPEMDQA
jgi:hypothetical protein